MVLMNASKMARHSASLVNRPNCGGTAKKTGTSKSVGLFLSSQPILLRGANAPAPFSLDCSKVKDYKIHTVQRTGYRATLGP
jgi:hypothetical protein